MRYLNYKHNDFNIAHFQGSSQLAFQKILDDIVETNNIGGEKFPENMSIMSVWTCDNKCILKQQLEKIGYNLINCYIPREEAWNNPYKIHCILDGLRKIDSKYVLILDGYDVVFNTFDHIIERFKEMNAGVVFNASKNNYPNFDGDLPYRTNSSKFRYLNAGCCIGYRDELIKFYELINEEYIKNPVNKWNSEQFIVRNAFAPFCNYTNEDYNLVKIDTKCDIFQTFGQVMLKNREEYVVVH